MAWQPTPCQEENKPIHYPSVSLSTTLDTMAASQHQMLPVPQCGPVSHSTFISGFPYGVNTRLPGAMDMRSPSYMSVASQSSSTVPTAPRQYQHHGDPHLTMYAEELNSSVFNCHNASAWVQNCQHFTSTFPNDTPGTAHEGHQAISAVKSPKPQATLFVCKWEGCNPPSCFKRPGDLIRHLRTVHVSPDAFPCPVKGCDKVFGRKDHLKEHCKRRHGMMSIRDQCIEC
ncbi:uncharacterized protein BDV17DRAFT_264918 [Aspergillus undulatus]|uniref:uncharacterized protein n=1 Tax=Aspergillus undulatus TaxID=1810928 RepID=UPI003CCCF3D6